MKSLFSRRPSAVPLGTFYIALLVVLAFRVMPLWAASLSSVDTSDISYALPSKLASQTLLLDVTHAGKRLVSVGSYGNIVYSDDDGKSWIQAASVPTQVTLTSVFFVSDKEGFAGGHDSTVVRTMDGGVHWTLVYRDEKSETPIMSVFFDTPLHGFAMGAFSFVIETIDGGQNWTRRSLSEGDKDDYHLNRVFASPDGAIFVAAEFGLVYRSTDHGASFVGIHTPYQGSFWGGISLPDGAILVYGMRGNAYRSTDDGANWIKVVTNTDSSISGGTVLSNGTVVLAGLQGFVGYSNDDGKTFTAVTRADRLDNAAVVEGPEDQIAVFGEVGVTLMPAKVTEAMRDVGAHDPGS